MNRELRNARARVRTLIRQNERNIRDHQRGEIEGESPRSVHEGVKGKRNYDCWGCESRHAIGWGLEDALRVLGARV